MFTLVFLCDDDCEILRQSTKLEKLTKLQSFFEKSKKKFGFLKKILYLCNGKGNERHPDRKFNK